MEEKWHKNDKEIVGQTNKKNDESSILPDIRREVVRPESQDVLAA